MTEISINESPSSDLPVLTPSLVPAFSAPPVRESTLWPLLALILGLGGAVSAFSLAGLVLVVLLFDAERSTWSVLPPLMIAGVGGLGLPLAWHAAQRLRNRPHPLWQTHYAWIIVGLILMSGALIVGQVALSLDLLPGLVVGPAQFMAVLASAAILLALTAQQWGGFNHLRAWWHFISGAWLAMVSALVMEIVVVGGLLIAGLVALTLLAPAEFRQLERAWGAYQLTQDLSSLSAWFSNPWVILGVFGLVSGLLPMLEELIKPLGVIALLRQRPTPMAAFLGGVLGGLGFGVAESLFNLTARQEFWFVLILARTGTLVMHGLTTGLVGWGWGQLAATRRPWRLLLAYALAVGLHGLWNAAAISISLLGLGVQSTGEQFSLQNLALGSGMIISLIVLVVLAMAGVLALAFIGYRLRHKEPPPAVGL